MKSYAQRSYKYAALFGVLCLGSLAAALVAASGILKIINFNAAIAFGGVALGYGVLGAKVFGKRGAKISWWSWLLFWPYFALNYVSLWFFRRASKENIADEVVPGLWIGSRLWTRDEKLLPTFLAVLDLTAEWSEVAFLQAAPSYLCVPVLDTTAPTLDELHRGVEFLSLHHARGTIYVHCALGHGRSATFIAAYLLSSQQASSIEEALIHLRKIRSAVDLHPAQNVALQQYFQTVSANLASTHDS